jgi:GT2 family glycosyltransferase
LTRSGDCSALSIVIPSWNTSDLLAECLSSSKDARTRGAQVIVVDDGSSDDSAARVEREFPDVVLLRHATSLGFATSANRGALRADREWLLLLNADTQLVWEAVDTLLAFLPGHPEYAAVAPRLLDPEGRTQRSCMRFPGWATPLFFGTPLERWFPRSAELRRYFYADFDHEHDRDVEQPPAAALLLAREEYLEMGGFDEGLPLFFNDVDLCLRLAQAGRRIRYLSTPQVIHHGGASTRQLADFASRWHRDRLTYYRKHHGRLAGLWVKACTALAWFDHVLPRLGKRLAGRSDDPLAPLCRDFGVYQRT